VQGTPGKVYVLEGGTFNTEVDDFSWLLNLKGDANAGVKFDLTDGPDWINISYDWNIDQGVVDAQTTGSYDWRHYANIGFGSPVFQGDSMSTYRLGWNDAVYAELGAIWLSAYGKHAKTKLANGYGTSGGGWNAYQYYVSSGGDPTDPNDRNYVNDFSTPAIEIHPTSYMDYDGDYIDGPLPDGDHRSNLIAGNGSQPDANLGGYTPDWAFVNLDGKDQAATGWRHPAAAGKWAGLDWHNVVHDGAPTTYDRTQMMVGTWWFGDTMGSADLGDTILRDVLVVQGDAWGDTDLDGDIDLTDLTNMGGGYGALSGATWGQGDSDGDGDVDLTDLTNLGGNYGFSGLFDHEYDTGYGVPEPASMALLAMGALAVLRRRRK
jgi:hypothetical protein